MYSHAIQSCHSPCGLRDCELTNRPVRVADTWSALVKPSLCSARTSSQILEVDWTAIVRYCLLAYAMEPRSLRGKKSLSRKSKVRVATRAFRVDLFTMNGVNIASSRVARISSARCSPVVVVGQWSIMEHWTSHIHDVTRTLARMPSSIHESTDRRLTFRHHAYRDHQ